VRDRDDSQEQNDTPLANDYVFDSFAEADRLEYDVSWLLIAMKSKN
jgi:hypothetical protein